MNIFDILGPVMVGPSSSHTAGAVRIGAMTRKLLGKEPVEAMIYLHGSFADTGVGHGTDKALIAGLLGMTPDNIDIPNSFEIAKEKKLRFKFEKIDLQGAHPNTAVIIAKSKEGTQIKVVACSLGGGRIQVDQIDDTEVCFTGEHPTLIIQNEDKPGHVAQIAAILTHHSINIATMQLCRDKRGGASEMVIETDQSVKKEALEALRALKGIHKVTYIEV